MIKTRLSDSEKVSTVLGEGLGNENLSLLLCIHGSSLSLPSNCLRNNDGYVLSHERPNSASHEVEGELKRKVGNIRARKTRLG